MFRIGAVPLDLTALGNFLTQPDVIYETRHAAFTEDS